MAENAATTGGLTPPRDRTVLLGKFGLLTQDEVAVLLDLEPLTLLTWRREGKGPDFCKLGGKVYYREQAVMDWIATNETIVARTTA